MSSKFLWFFLFLCLPVCQAVAFYGEPCDEPGVHCDQTLTCGQDPITSKRVCLCNPNLVQVSTTHCGSPGDPYSKTYPSHPNYHDHNLTHRSLRAVTTLPASLNDPCDPGPRCGPDPSWNLVCQAGICVCRLNTVEHTGRRCGPPATFGQTCNLPSCDDGPGFNLMCHQTTTTRQCECSNSTHVQHNGGRCDRPANFGEPCNLPACKPRADLICKNKICECHPGTYNNPPTQTCENPVLYGGDCTYLPCSGNTECFQGAGGLKRCICIPGNLPRPGNTCGLPAGFGNPCNTLPPYCGFDLSWNVTCVSHRCVCSTAEFVEHPGRKCGPPSRFGQACYPNPACLNNANLNCGTSRTCECVAGFYPKLDGTCRPPVTWGELCDSIPCKSGVNLECTGVSPSRQCSCVFPNVPAVEFPNNLAQTGGCGRSPPMTLGEKCEVRSGRYECKLNVDLRCDTAYKTCFCARRWMELDPSTGGCKNRPPSHFNGPCELDQDCVPNGNLKCVSSRQLCACRPFHEPDPAAGGRTCRRRASRYDEPCEMDSNCLFGHQMICETNTTRRCRCKYSFDLDNGRTPCRFSVHNGRTYSQPCENSPAIRRCVVSHNLTCQANRCVCLTDHVVTEDTIQDPAFRVATCRLGRGTQGHGQNCVAAAANPGDRCDEFIGLNCGGQFMCTCADGYVPNDPKRNPRVPCTPGDRLYNATCDPAEYLVRAQPIDPNTGAPFPGPTSPPPPIFACNLSRNLVCFNGGCECRHQRVSARFIYDGRTQTCLINPGYACVFDEECVTNRCVNRSEAALENSGEQPPPSHDHGTSICSGRVKLPGNFGHVITPIDLEYILGSITVTLTNYFRYGNK